MKIVDPAELSALIDGELDAGRAADIRTAMDGDAQLRQQYEALRSVDARLHKIAAAVVLDAQFQLPANAAAHAAGVSTGRFSLAVLVIIAAWAVGKLTAVMPLALVLSACALTALIVVLMAVVAQEEQRWHTQMTAGTNL
jgi:anti-sigma factor RsiW